MEARPREADVVVVGAGIVGCATAYFLARRGLRVVVVERGRLPGEQSRKNWGFVRQQGRDPLEMPLMLEANRMWRGLERELGADIEWTQGGNLALAADEARMACFEQWCVYCAPTSSTPWCPGSPAASPAACTRPAMATPTPRKRRTRSRAPRSRTARAFGSSAPCSA